MIRATITSSRKREKDKMPKAYEMKNNLAFISKRKKKFSFSLFYLITMIVHETINKKGERKFSCMWQNVRGQLNLLAHFFINIEDIKLLLHQH